MSSGNTSIPDVVYKDADRIAEFLGAVSERVEDASSEEFALTVGANSYPTRMEIVKKRQFKSTGTGNQIRQVVTLLRHKGLLDSARPTKSEPEWRIPTRFVLEKCRLSEVVIPVPATAGLKIASLLRFWVSMPDRPYCRKPWDPDQTMLIVTPAVYAASEPYEFIPSGWSALQLVLEAAGAPHALAFQSGDRENVLHPIELLKQSGARIGDAIHCEVLYRKRLFSDEIFFKDEGASCRMNAIIGYALYVARL